MPSTVVLYFVIYEIRIFFLENGRVFCFGKNGFGQLGLGHTENVYKPNCVKSKTHFNNKKKHLLS